MGRAARRPECLITKGTSCREREGWARQLSSPGLSSPSPAPCTGALPSATPATGPCPQPTAFLAPLRGGLAVAGVRQVCVGTLAPLQVTLGGLGASLFPSENWGHRPLGAWGHPPPEGVRMWRDWPRVSSQLTRLLGALACASWRRGVRRGVGGGCWGAVLQVWGLNQDAAGTSISAGADSCPRPRPAGSRAGATVTFPAINGA